MNTDKHTAEYNELLRLIDRYFDGATSLDEERRLRAMLAVCDSDDDIIEEARAVTGVFAAARRQSSVANAGRTSAARRLRRRHLLVAVSVAASVAIMIGAALSLSNISIGNAQSGTTIALASEISPRQGNHDTVACLMKDGKTASHGRRMMVMAASVVNMPDTPDDVAALISSEMGLMAEAQRNVYDSVADDFVSISAIF